MLGKRRALGKELKDISIGDSYSETKKMGDRDLLLYLGLSNDANPLYLQHDYASLTDYKKPIVPSVMLFGMISSIVSMHLPGPGSHITQHEMTFPNPVYHNMNVQFLIKVIAIDHHNQRVAMSVSGTDQEGNEVVKGKLYVCPACKPNTLTAQSLENFF
ncbi:MULTISPECIES: MaoC/PaaZ C-terminal domain-containing protein [Virgibacillus]|uniref:(R)-specific enoyl-CoA hydratase n=2 Tax=Virgibacillus TaxID=84406 RepID=A0A024QA22_9BACI|nr:MULTISPECIES: MaoC/PaaZ C-terminal domain-containing protein [Virgibacillus]EQB35731.1 hypothetical protein M948_11860 [Virgibacillus sp. CM-4]GGJ50188.1 enoyl-CoA hydratase [Virgibacillus kapii]CDQ39339.1 (R)-specific enoyl-CoA hydratase [Virgibacillus massiliensis]